MKHKLKGGWATKEARLDGVLLSPEPSQKVVNHSPDGFAWGYGGSGPAQLASAITLKLTGSRDGYMLFKEKVIAGLSQSDFDVVIDV